MSCHRARQIVITSLLWLSVLVFLTTAAGCGKPQPTPTEGLRPTVARAVEVTPTPTPDIEQVFPAVTQLCGDAFSSAVQEGTVETPILVVKRGPGTYRMVNGTAVITWSWVDSPLLRGMTSLAASEVRTLVCVQETLEQVGCYTGSGGIISDLAMCALSPPANVRHWDVGLVRMQDRRLIGVTNLVGGDPPESITLPTGPGTVYIPGTGGASGSEPIEALLHWIQERQSKP